MPGECRNTRSISLVSSLLMRALDSVSPRVADGAGKTRPRADRAGAPPPDTGLRPSGDPLANQERWPVFLVPFGEGPRGLPRRVGVSLVRAEPCRVRLVVLRCAQQKKQHAGESAAEGTDSGGRAAQAKDNSMFVSPMASVVPMTQNRPWTTLVIGMRSRAWTWHDTASAHGRNQTKAS